MVMGAKNESGEIEEGKEKSPRSNSISIPYAVVNGMRKQEMEERNVICN